MYDQGFFKFDSTNPDHYLLNDVLGSTSGSLTARDLEDIFPTLARDYGDTGVKVTLQAYEHPTLKIRPGWDGNLVLNFPSKMEVFTELDTSNSKKSKNKKSYQRLLQIESNVEILMDLALSNDKMYLGMIGTDMQSVNVMQDTLDLTTGREEEVIETLNSRF